MTAFTDLAPYKGYRDGLAAGELRYMACDGCRSSIFYPRVVCPHCGSTALAWRTSAGRGEIYSISTIPQDGGSYTVALIDLDEGFRFMSTVVGATPAIGDRVHAVAEQGDGTRPPRIVFEPLENAQ